MTKKYSLLLSLSIILAADACANPKDESKEALANTRSFDEAHQKLVTTKLDKLLHLHVMLTQIGVLGKIHNLHFFEVLKKNQHSLDIDDRKKVEEYAHQNDLNSQEQQLLSDYLNAFLKAKKPGQKADADLEVRTLRGKLVDALTYKELDKLVRKYVSEGPLSAKNSAS
jgi:hypothetical protein